MDLAIARIEDTLKGYVPTVQDFAQLCRVPTTGIFPRPWYARETL